MRIFFLILIFYSLSHGESVSREQLSELHQIRSEIKSAVFDQSRFKQDILKAQLDIESQSKEIQKNQNETNETKEKILERIASLYKIRRAYPDGALISLIQQENFLRRNYYLKYLNNQDKSLITEYRTKTDSIHKLKNRVQSYMKKLVDLQKKNETKFKQLEAREERQRELIKKIRLAVYSQDQIPVQNLEKKFFSELRGSLQLPTNGKLKGQLGLEKDSVTKLNTLRTGLNVEANAGTEVRSVFEGEVLHAAPIQGWGPTIIVDHGESYYSVYSHLKNLSVRPGDRVISQQKLAEVSTVAYHKKQSDQGLYFEIRHYSEPEDPRAWFKGEQE